MENFDAINNATEEAMNEMATAETNGTVGKLILAGIGLGIGAAGYGARVVVEKVGPKAKEYLAERAEKKAVKKAEKKAKRDEKLAERIAKIEEKKENLKKKEDEKKNKEK